MNYQAGKLYRYRPDGSLDRLISWDENTATVCAVTEGCDYPPGWRPGESLTWSRDGFERLYEGPIAESAPEPAPDPMAALLAHAERQTAALERIADLLAGLDLPTKRVLVTPAPAVPAPLAVGDTVRIVALAPGMDEDVSGDLVGAESVIKWIDWIDRVADDPEWGCPEVIGLAGTPYVWRPCDLERVPT
jgi:hypothetical protein